jgi:hypothetical protein
MYGQSSVRQVALATGEVLRKKMLDPSDFGEGLTRLGDKCAALPLLAACRWCWCATAQRGGLFHVFECMV